MNIIQIGPKNYPPDHGGVEKIVYDITKNSSEFNHYIFVQWPQKETNNVKVLPNGIINQIKYIKKYTSKIKSCILHFHKEVFIPHAIWFSLFNSTVVLTIHGCAWRLKRWNYLYRIAFYTFDLLACIIISKVIFVSKTDYNHFKQIIFWRKLYFIPNGTSKVIKNCSPDGSKCVYIGRISPEKNIIKMIHMFKNLDITLTIYGPFDKNDVSYKTLVLNEINKFSNVEYGGILDYTEILSTLSNYNTFYNISLSEGMPVSVLEAASLGLNLVLSNIPQHRDLLFPDVYYVDPINPKNTIIFKGNSLKNKSHLETNYSLESSVNKYRNIYNKIML